MARRNRSAAQALATLDSTTEASFAATIGLSWLVVIRESATERFAFTNMVRRVVSNLRQFGVPGLDQAEQIGATIFSSAAVRAELTGLKELRRTGARPGAAPYGYLFSINGTWFLFAQISARHTSHNQDNDFTRDVTDAVRTLRPTHLGTGPTSRLCRHRDHVATLNLALENAGGPTTLIVCDESRRRALNLRYHSDRETWDGACADAVADYHATRRRLSAGTATGLALGEWAFSGDTLPAGYMLHDDHTFLVKPDPTLREFVAEVIRVSAQLHDDGFEGESDPRREWVEAQKAIVEVCDRHGWMSAGLARRHGPDAKFSHGRTALRNAERLWSYLPLWQSGKYEMRHRLSLGIDSTQKEYNGVPLERVVDEHGNETVYMTRTLDFGSFDWNEEEQELLRQAIERRSPDKRAKGTGGRKPGQSHTNTPFLPLLSLCDYIDVGKQFRMVRSGDFAYRLVERPAHLSRYPSGERRGWAPNEGTGLATLQSDVLHEQLAAAAVGLIERGGVAPRLTRLDLPAATARAAEAADDYSYRTKELRTQIDRLVRRASVLREQETDARVDEQFSAADDYKEKARKADDQADRLRRELASLTPPEPAVTVLPPGTTSDLGDVAVALAALARCEADGSDELHQALACLIVDLRAHVTPFAVEISFSLRLPTTEGPLLLGPATFVLPNTRRANKTARVAAMLDLYFLEGLSWDVIGQRVTRAPELAQSQVRKHLAEHFPELSAGARTAILNCPIADTRRVVWHSLTGVGSVDDLPAAWVAHIKDVYLTAMPPRKGWAHDTSNLRREVLAHVLANQVEPEEGVLISDVATVTGYSVHRISRLTEPVPSATGMDYQPSYERVPDSPWGTTRATKKSRIRARMCPWCSTRTATLPLRVPECPDDLICTACHRMPSDPDVVFPAEYLEAQPTMAEAPPSDNAGQAAGPAEAPAAWKMRRQRAAPGALALVGQDEKAAAK